MAGAAPALGLVYYLARRRISGGLLLHAYGTQASSRKPPSAIPHRRLRALDPSPNLQCRCGPSQTTLGPSRRGGTGRWSGPHHGRLLLERRGSKSNAFETTCCQAPRPGEYQTDSSKQFRSHLDLQPPGPVATKHKKQISAEQSLQFTQRHLGPSLEYMHLPRSNSWMCYHHQSRRAFQHALQALPQILRIESRKTLVQNHEIGSL